LEQIRDILQNYYNQKDFAGLIDYCNSKIDSGDNNYLYFGAKGKANIELKDFDKAIVDLTKALELNTDYATGLYNRGICYYMVHKIELAIQDLEKAKSNNSEFYQIDFYLGGSYCYLEDYEIAIELFTSHLSHYEDDEALQWRADLYYFTDQFELANNDITELLLHESELIDYFEDINEIGNFPEIPSEPEISSKSFSICDLGFSIIYNNDDCGIYILEFTNNEYYIGQAKKIQHRINQHFSKYHDIESVYFKAVPFELLLSEENTTISIFEKNKLRIRNLKQLKFKNIFTESDQIQWLNNLHFNTLTGTKFNNDKVRERFKDRFLILREKPYFEELIMVLAKYIALCIPNYIAGEYNYWNITCLPKYLEEDNCLARINVNAVPVLSVYESSENSLRFIIFSSRLPFLRHFKQQRTLKSLFDHIPQLEIDIEKYFEEKTEGDEIRLLVDLGDFQTALNNELILSSIRLFNLRMMNNTGKELKFRRKTYHCLDLADLIIIRIQ
jgi:tetratricopeptide (TPR) repeat protein